MSKNTSQWYILTEDQLLRLVGQGTYPDATDALEQVRRIKETDQTTSIYYSAFNGFRIINENDPEQFRIGLSLSNRAKPFKM